MKVKIGNKIYNAENEPIMIILNDSDKFNITHMPAENYKYCAYPSEGYSEDDIRAWMEINLGLV
jgi:hypothetical protein